IPGVSGPGANFQSFNDAKAAMVDCGILGPVVFEVEPNSGPYEESLKLDSIRGTSSTNTITFMGNGNTIRFNSNANQAPSNSERAVIKLNGAEQVIIDRLVIGASGTYPWGYGVKLNNNAESNSVQKSSIMASKTSTSQNSAAVVIYF